MTTVQRVFRAAQRLSPAEQLELIQAISHALQLRYRQEEATGSIPSYIKRTPPVTDIAQLAADFWPEDETADDINAYIVRQRREDLMREQ